MTKSEFREKVASRKFILMFMILTFSTLCLIFPTLLAWGAGVKLGALMTGGEYVSLTIGTFAIYSSANVVQKKLEGTGLPTANTLTD